MSDKDLKLNALSDAEARLLHVHPEWRIDPAILLRFKEEDWQIFARAQLEFLAEKAKLEARAKELEAKMFEKIAVGIGK